MTKGTERGRVAITGLGIVSSLGTSLKEISQSLKEGRSGIIVDEERKRRGFRSALTARRPELDLKSYGLGRKQLRAMDDPAIFAYVSAKQAIEDAGWKEEDLKKYQAGLIFGNDSTVRAAINGIKKMEKTGTTRGMGAGAIFQGMNSTITMNLATLFGLTGANWTLSAACASGAHSVGQAYLLIRSGLQKIVLAGGAQEITWEGMAAFDALGAFSTRQDDPTKASRPFDKNRDGLVPSGGGATLILEDMELAKKRGARIYGEIIGYGFSSDGYHLSKPHPDGGKRAITMALQAASLNPEEIDYINAHATSTIQGDANEAIVLGSIFPSCPPLSSTKSMTGHECWMSGASEIGYSLLMAHEGFIAPNINFEEPDDITKSLNIVAETREANIKTFLSNSLGFGGTNAALIVSLQV